MSRRMIQNMQIPRYPNGSIGWTFNRWTRPIAVRRLTHVDTLRKKAEAKLLELTAAKS